MSTSAKVASIATPYQWVDISKDSIENRMQSIKEELSTMKKWTDKASKLMKCPPMLHHYDKAEFCINSLLGVDVETVGNYLVHVI